MRKKNLTRWKRGLSLTMAFILTLSLNTSAVLAAETGQTAEPASANETLETGDIAKQGNYTEEDTSAIVTFKDSNLKKALNQALASQSGTVRADDADITENEMASLTELVAENAGITDLNGLEYAVNLENLDLSGNDLSEMSKRLTNIITLFRKFEFTKLKTVDFSNCNLGKYGYGHYYISYLYKSTELVSADLSDNSMEGTFQFVAGAKDSAFDKLEELNLSNNGLTAFWYTTQYSFPSLKKVDLSNNRIWLNENAGDWYEGVVKLGVEKFDVSNQKSLTDLDNAYISGIDSNWTDTYIDNENRVIDFGTTLNSSITFKLQGYGEMQTLSGMIEGADMPVMIASPDTFATNVDNCLFTLELSEGVNEFKLTLTHVSGETADYTIKVTRNVFPEAEDSAGIQDISLQKAICTALNKLDEYKENPLDYTTHVVTKEEMTKLTTLTATNVSNISGIQYAENLTSLSLTGDYTGAVDVSGMNQLTSLKLSGNFEGISGLEASKETLKTLLLTGEYSTVDGIGSLTKLTSLTLQGNFSEVEGLNNLTGLTTLSLRGKFASAVSLQGLEKIKNLTVSPAADGTLPDMSGLQELSTLYIYDCQENIIWQDLTLPKLSSVYLNDCHGTVKLPAISSQASSVYISVKMKQGEDVTIDIGNVNDLSAKYRMSLYPDTYVEKTITLTGNGNSLSNISFSSGGIVKFSETFQAENLTEFSCSSCKIETFPAADALPNVSTLRLSAATLPDNKLPEAVGSMEKLQSLSLSTNGLTDLSSIDLSGCTSLTSVDFSFNSGLKGELDASVLPESIQTLKMYDTRITALTGDWSKFTNLTTLNLQLNYMADFPVDAVKQLTSLKQLNINNNLYTVIPEDTFENSVNLTNVWLGNYMPLVRTENGWEADPDSETGRAIAKLKETVPSVSVSIASGPGTLQIPSGNYSGLVELKTSEGSISGDVFTSSDMALMVPADAEQVTITPRALLEDTVITVDGTEYKTGDDIVIPLSQQVTTVTIKCTNDYSNYLNLDKETTYTLTITAGEYMEEFQPEEGGVYDVEMSL